MSDYALTHHAVCGPGRSRSGDHSTAFELLDPAVVVIVVCDGVGSLASDWLASQIACRTIAKVLTHQTSPLAIRAAAAIESAHAAVKALDGPHAGGGTTAVLVLWRHGADCVHYVNVGDSRLYRASATGLTRLTADDARQIPAHDRGRLVISDGAVAFTSGLTRAIGIGELGEVTVQEAPFREGEMLVASTDGFHELPGFATAIAEVYAASAIGRSATEKLGSIHDLAGRDDGSIVLLRREAVPGALMAACLGRLRRRSAAALDETYPVHLLRKGLAAAMSRLIAEGDFAAVLHGIEAAQRLQPGLARSQIAGLLDSLPAQGSAEALAVYRSLVRLASQAR